MSEGTARARAAAGGIALTLAVCVAGGFFGSRELLGVGVQAALAEWGTERLGVTWSDPATKARAPDLARRAAVGLAIGAAGAIATHGFAPRAIADTLRAPFLLLATLGSALLVAVRDEVLLHGLVLRVIDPWRGGARPRGLAAVAIAACAAASAAWAIGTSGGAGIPLGRLAIETLAGGALGAMWLRDRGAWMPTAAHFAWRLAGA